ncbi:hypothetical protein ABPG74_014603 [Tetrahymena malaccensis]
MKIQASFLSKTIVFLFYLIHTAYTTWRQINTEFVGSSWPSTLKNWQIIGVSTTPTSVCTQNPSNQKIFGGQGKFGTGVILIKSYSSLPPHKNIRISFNGYFIATQAVASASSKVTFCGDYNTGSFICNPSAQQKTFSYTDAVPFQCQLATATEQKYAFSLTFAHSNLNVNFAITNNFLLQSNALSFAMSDFELDVDACHSSCATCSGDTFDTCLTCVINASLINSSCVCNPGYYPQYQQAPCLTSPCLICQLCYKDCSTCYGPGQNQCLSCKNTNSPLLFLQNFTCISGSSCNPGTYPDTSALQCLPCNQSCATCIGSSDLLCTSCSSQRYLNPINVGDTFGKCVSTCPPAKVLVGSQCVPCADTDCIQCQNSAANTCQLCTTDTTKNYLLFTNICVSDRPSDSYYIDSAKRQIFPCISPCSTCSQYQGSVCLTCVTGYSLSLSTCVTKCPDSQYSLNQVCTNCDTNCLTCSGTAVHCLTCKTNMFVDPLDFTCKVCQGSTYGDVVSGTCKPCDPSCQTCNGGSNLNCLSCYQAGAQPYYIASTLQCVSNCPAFPQDLYGNDMSTPKLCVQGQNCPAQYFPDATSNPRKCNPCNATCSQCFGPSNNQCSGCSGSLVLQGTVCINSCIPGYYADINRICQICDTSCKECNGGGPNSCTKCSSPLFLSTSAQGSFCKVTCDSPTYGEQGTLTCVGTCQPNFYANDNTRLCTPCHPACNGCTGGQKSNCNQCAAPYFKFKDNCDYCPDSYYGDASAKECKPCPSECAICTDLLSCQKCNPSYFLEGSTCVPQCTLPKWGSQLTNTCVNTCPIRTYGDINQRVCKLCSQNCANCQDSQNCIDCFYPYFLNNSNQCVLLCPSNQFANRQLRICQNCDPSCKTCSGGDSQSCQSCQSGSYLYNGACYTICPNGTFSNGDYCQASCQIGFYPDITNNACKKCDPGCLECYGKLFDNCITCQSGFALVNSQCVTTCPNGYYEELLPVSQVSSKSQNQNDNMRTCSLCPTQCQLCSNTLSANLSQKNIICSQCSAENYLNDQQCIQNCPNGKIINIPNRTCDSCPDGYYKYDNQTCKQCHFSCKQCTGQNYNQCTLCWDNRGREYIQPDKTVVRLPYQSVCECDPGLSDLMDNECVSSIGNEFRTVQASESFSIMFPCLMFFDLYFFGNPINLLFSFEVVQQISLLQYTNVPLSLDIMQLLHFIQGFHLTDLPPKPLSLEVNSPNSQIQPSQSTSRLLASIQNQDSYYKFSSNNKSNNFLNNSIYLIGVHLLLWAFIFFCKISQKNFQLKRLGFLNKVYFYLDLTVMLLVYFLTNYEMILNIILQLNDVDTSTSYNSFSFALCIIFLVYYFFFFVKIIFKVNVDKIFFKSKPPRKPYLINQFTRWCLLFFTIRQRQSLQRNFYVLLQIKKIITCILLITLYSIPSAQILSTMVVYILFFFYLALYKPIVNPYILALLLINEGFMILFYILSFLIYQQQYSHDTSLHLNRTLLALLFLVFFANLLIGFLIIFKKRVQIKQQLLSIYTTIRNYMLGRNRVKDYQDKLTKKRKNKRIKHDDMGDIVEEDENDEEEEDEESEQEQGEDDFNQDVHVENIDGESSGFQQNEKIHRRFKKKKLNDQNNSSVKSFLNRIESTEYYNIEDPSANQKRHGVVYLKEDLNYQQKIEFKNRLRRDQRLPKIQQSKSNQLNQNINNNQKSVLMQLQMNQKGRQQNAIISSNQLNSSNQLDNSIVQHIDNSMDQSYQQILVDNNNQNSSQFNIVDLDQEEWIGKRKILQEKLDQVDEMDEIIDEALDQDDEINMERLRQIQLMRSEQSYHLRQQQRSQRGNPQDLRESYIQQQQNYNNYEEYVGTNEDFNNRPSSRLERYDFNNINQFNQNMDQRYNQMQQNDPNQNQEGDDYNMYQDNNNQNLQFQELFGFDRIEYYDHSLDEEQRMQREAQDQNYRQYMMQQQQNALQSMNVYQNNLKYQSSALKKNPTRNYVSGVRDYSASDLVDRYNEVDPEQLKKYLEYKKKYKLTQKFGFLSKSSLSQSPEKRQNSNQSRVEDPRRIDIQLQQFYQQQ